MTTTSYDLRSAALSLLEEEGWGCFPIFHFIRSHIQFSVFLFGSRVV